jgi:hypothetical protein
MLSFDANKKSAVHDRLISQIRVGKEKREEWAWVTPYEGDSNDPNKPGLKGVSHAANGGVVGVNDWPATGQPPGSGGNGGWFESLKGEGVRGLA